MAVPEDIQFTETGETRDGRFFIRQTVPRRRFDDRLAADDFFHKLDAAGFNPSMEGADGLEVSGIRTIAEGSCNEQQKEKIDELKFREAEKKHAEAREKLQLENQAIESNLRKADGCPVFNTLDLAKLFTRNLSEACLERDPTHKTLYKPSRLGNNQFVVPTPNALAEDIQKALSLTVRAEVTLNAEEYLVQRTKRKAAERLKQTGSWIESAGNRVGSTEKISYASLIITPQIDPIQVTSDLRALNFIPAPRHSRTFGANTIAILGGAEVQRLGTFVSISTAPTIVLPKPTPPAEKSPAAGGWRNGLARIKQALHLGGAGESGSGHKR